jgi:Uma2 family endonuclease
MSALRRPDSYISVEEYLEGEMLSEVRHEYCDGQVFRMEGGTARHGETVLYLARKIADHLEGGPCQVFSQSLKVRVPLTAWDRSDLFYYPDVIVACEPDDRHRLYREKPKLLIEVASPSNPNKDRVEKYLVYQSIPTLEEYVYVSPEPDTLIFVVCRRQDEWQASFNAAFGTAHLASIGLSIDVTALFERLKRLD